VRLIIGRGKPAPVPFSPPQIPRSLSYKSTVLSVETLIFIYCTKRLLVLARDCGYHESGYRSKMEIFTVVWGEAPEPCRYYYITLRNVHSGGW